ncbi:MAG: hypothetical protein COA78_38060, partial [Blastopirellula sp.]
TENIATKDIQLSSSNLAYIIYTSGSTGKPKGVMIEHKSAISLLTWGQETYSEAELRAVLASTTICFDLSIFEIFLPLAAGGSLVVVRDILDLVASSQLPSITLINTVPSAIKELAKIGKIPGSVVTINLAGEVLHNSVVQLVKENSQVENIYNLYGPSEDTTYTTFSKVDLYDSSEPNIGKPISNTGIYVLDQSRTPLPIGAVGEIYVSGEGLARGYLNNPELTKDKFVPNSINREKGDRLYRTGDLAKWMPDGSLKFLGRNDFQIKLRGFRIELGEIENVLMSHRDVTNCVVLMCDRQQGDKYLVAYVVLDDIVDSQIHDGFQSRLQEYIQHELPPHMVPGAFVILDSLPLTPNGKIDRNSLPALDQDTLKSRKFVTPKTITEKVVADLWSEILGLESREVSVNDNFFSLGGHSLLIPSLVHKLEKRGILTDVHTVFKAESLQVLANFLDESTPNSSYSLEESFYEISPDCDDITPAMLPLVDLSEKEIAGITEHCSGGMKNIQDVYPLGPLQEGILFHHLLHKENDPYIILLSYAVETKQLLDKYLAALQSLVDHHDVLRTLIYTENVSSPVQVVLRKSILMVEEFQLNPDVDTNEQLEELIQEPQTMSLDRAPLLRVKITRKPNSTEWVVLLQFHHIVLDHISLDIINSEIKNFIAGDSSIPTPPSSYRNFISQTKRSGNSLEAEQYFGNMLGGFDEPSIAFDLRKDGSNSTKLGEKNKLLSPDLSQKIRDCTSSLALSPSVLFHVALSIVVAHSSGRKDIVFGTVMSGRLHANDYSRTLGLFINTLPIRLNLEGKNLRELLSEANLTIANLIRYEQTSLTLAQSCSDVDDGTPLFNTLLNYRHSKNLGDDLGLKSDEGRITPLGSRIRTNYPVSIAVDDFGKQFAIDVKVDGVITADRMLSYFESTLENLVESLSSTLDQPVESICMIPDSEREQLIYDWNNTDKLFLTDKCIHELFEEQVSKTPNNAAVIYRDYECSYKLLNEKANRLAHYLIKNGVQANTLVGLYMERSLDLMVALLGIMKAGGTYIPLDPASPKARVTQILESSSAEFVVTHNRLKHNLYAPNQLVVCLDEVAEAVQILNCDDKNPTTQDTALSSDCLAYVIFTSGSTGMPKGVMISHKNVVNFLQCAVDAFVTGDIVGSVVSSTVAFDATVQSLYVPLCCGKFVEMLEEGNTLIDSLSERLICSSDPLLFKITPSHLKAVLGTSQCSEVSRTKHSIVVAGEELTAGLLQSMKVFLPQAIFHNEYGPTETTVGSSAFPVPSNISNYEASDRIPIGKPFPNVNYYVLDEKLNTKAIYCKGELYIGGEGIAEGYLNQPNLTVEKFVNNPFSKHANRKIYRTGDLVRWLEDGNIEFLGRIDNQVKVRGFRVELSEIEHYLSELDEVKDVVVLTQDLGNIDKSIVGYVVLTEDACKVGQYDYQAGWREHLKNKLPKYMIPAAFVVLPKFPETLSGKIDRNSLPRVGEDDLVTVEYVSPRSQLEESLAVIWADLFDTDVGKISALENFFDLGGHSLLAVNLSSVIRSKLGLELSLSDVFNNPVLEDLAKAVEKAQISDPRSVISSTSKGPGKYLASYAQKRLWFIDQLSEGSSAHYNMPGAVKIYGKFESQFAEVALQRIVNRHDSLRTVFVGDEDVWQIVNEHVKFELQQIDMSLLSKLEQEHNVLTIVNEEAATPFNLSRDLMLRGTFIRLADEEVVLLFNMHHIASDGTSLAVFISEFHQQYDAVAAGKSDPLSPLDIQYVDYSNWQNDWMQGEVKRTQLNYWKKQLSDLPPVHSLPLNFPRPSTQSYAGRNHKFKLDRSKLRALKALASSHQSSLFMVLHAVLSILHARIGTSKDVVIGTPMANRLQKELEPLIGFFLNTIVLRTDCSENIPFSEFLSRVKEINLKAQTYQDIPFEYLVEHLNPDRSAQYTPLFQVMLHLNNTPVVTAAEKAYSNDYYGEFLESQDVLSKFEMTLHAWEADEELHFMYEYKTDLFSEDTIATLSNSFLAIMQGVVSDPDRCILELPVLDPSSENKLLCNWTNTNIDYRTDLNLHELFLEQSASSPKRIAVKDAT